MADSLPVLSGSACAHLRSKGMYVTGTMNPAVDDIEQLGDGHCWCHRTQGVVGPDDGLVERTNCTAARACYEALT